MEAVVSFRNLILQNLDLQQIGAIGICQYLRGRQLVCKTAEKCVHGGATKAVL